MNELVGLMVVVVVVIDPWSRMYICNCIIAKEQSSRCLLLKECPDLPLLESGFP